MKTWGGSHDPHAFPSRRDVLNGASALALGAALGTRAAQAREITARQKELYELAKKEGEVTWYTAHSNDTTAQALGRDFEAAFPGIKVNVVRTTAQVAYQRADPGAARPARCRSTCSPRPTSAITSR